MALASVLISCFALTSCGSDDNDDNDSPDNPETENYAELIVGTWEDDDEENSRLVFNANGSGYEMYYEDGSWEIEAIMDWRIRGNNLSLAWKDDDTITCTIMSLDKKHLVVLINVDGEYVQSSLTKVK